MKRILLSIIGISALLIAAPLSTASAADMPLKAPPPPPAPVYSWTGFYVGANGGYGWDHRTVSYSPNDPPANFLLTTGLPPPGPTSFNSNGGLGGLQAGYNWQLNPKWLLGLEADFDWSGIKGNGISIFQQIPAGVVGGPSNIQANQDINWFGTMRARLGFLPANNTLIYATAGLAYGHTSEQLTLNGAGFANGPQFGWQCSSGPVPPPLPVTKCFVGSSSRTETGWTIGGGLEYAPWNNNLTLKVEYLYINLGGDTTNLVALSSSPALPSSITASSRTDFSVLRGGINWKL
jgi:outer membrane immunogenic protein